MYLDFDTMTSMDLMFRTEQKIHCFSVELGTGCKRGTGKVEFWSVSN